MIGTEPTKLLPAASTTTPPDTGSGFDMRAFAAELKSKPKQDYTQSQPKPAEPPPASTAPPGQDAPPKEEEKGPENPNTEGSAKETAAAVLMMYDNLVSQVCAAIADHKDYPAKSFAMDPSSRKEAERQLAIGIERNNWAGLPWWGILGMMVLASGVANWLMVREARKKKKEAAADANKNRERAKNGEAVYASTITDKNGRTTGMPDVPPPTNSTAPDVKTPGAPKDYGPCQAPGCTNRLTKPRRKYCSQSCSGKASTKHSHP